MNSLMKVTRLSIYTLLLILVLFGCSAESSSTAAENDKGSDENKLVVDTLRYSGSAGQVTFWELAEDLGYLDPLKLEWTGNSTSGPENIQATVSNSIDFGGAFNGAIIKLKEAGAPITSVIGYYGSDEQTFNGYYVLEDSPIKEAKDLIGKKIGVNTLGAHHEFAIIEYLRREGLTEKEIDEVSLVVIPPASGEQALRSGQLDATTLGGVLQDKALERGGIRPLFKDTDLFGSFTAGSLVFRDDFIKKNPNTVAKFVEGTAKAIEWARNTPVFPPLSTVLIGWWELAATGQLIEHITASFIRSIIGFGIAVIVAIPLGLTIGWYKRFSDIANPLLEAFRNTAALAILPVFILLLGIGEASKIAVVIYACSFPILLSTISAVRNVDPLFIKSAKSMALSPVKLFLKVILPAAVPTIFVGIRLAASSSILVLVAAEMIGAKAGLGYLIISSQQNFQIAYMYSGILTISALGMLVNTLLLQLEGRLSRWKVHQ
ncbi:ABC transporter permease subunit [uncultured Metabacillus sp.]|uniref:ABC transporter permease subunit n=1 Tax=uncultured Metabacillus sp. TaxID=2860135 RepID=UPI00345A86C8